MLSDNDLRDLLAFTASEPVLSIYLDLDPLLGNADAHRLHLRTMLKEVKLPLDVAAVEKYFQFEFPWTGRSVAVFSCAGQKFFRAVPLAVRAPNLVHVGDRPSVRILAGLLDSYGGYGVALVDKQGARLFHFHLGELREQEGVVGEAVKHLKTGGSSSVAGMRGSGSGREVEEVVERNMRESLDFALHFFEENHIRRVLIGGSDENAALFQSMLPKAWQSLVVGKFTISMNASHLDVLNKTLQIGHEVEQKREAYLVENLITTAAKGGSAVTGLDAVLKMIAEHRIQTLVIVEGFHIPAYRCTDCNAVTTNPDICLECKKEVEILPDGVDYAVSMVMQTGGEVEVVQSSHAFEKVGSVGAFLRY